jgi:predicted secreted protein
MTQTHLITPPRELVKKIFGDALRGSDGQHDYELRLIHAAYAAGADHELKACCDLLLQEGAWPWPEEVARLRAARRPKPPSRKEQALEAIGRLCASVIHDDLKNDAATIRRALEALDD